MPFRHLSDISELTDAERLELMQLLALSKEALAKTMSPHGFNVGMNLGQVAGAGVKDHLHFHILPRWNGDTNFMPINGHTKVVSEGLMETWENLKNGYDKKVGDK